MLPASTISYVLISITSFMLGVIVGWLGAQNLTQLEETALRRLMAVVLLGAYIVSVLAEIRLGHYTTPMLLHAIMGGVVGYLFSQGDGFNINIGQK